MGAKSSSGTIAGRAKRYVRVGAAVGGFAARAVGGRLRGDSIAEALNASDLRAALGGLKGPLMKVAQILSTVPDALPHEFAVELTKLQADAPSMGWPFVKRRMKTELGEDWESRFASFERQAAAAASLGQVHRAVSLDGALLACKLQYPDMASVVEADLRQLKLAFALYRRYDRSIDPEGVHAELSERLREELDYGREARNMVLYQHMLREEPGVHVPAPVSELSTDRLLCMNWLDGAPLRTFVGGGLESRNRIALNMFRAWYAPFYNYGVIHGDPHMGNYTARPDCSINLLDFGCVRIFKPSFVKGVIDLYKALRDGDEELAVHAYEGWGFEGLSREMVGVLNQWALFIYAPLLDDRKRPIQESDAGIFGAAEAAKVHAQLRRLGGVKPPPAREFVLVDRAAIGLGSVFLRLKAKINWHGMFHDLIDDFDEKALAARQKKALAQFVALEVESEDTV